MKTLLTNARMALLLAAGIGCSIPIAVATHASNIVSGGGSGTFNADLDGDGDIDGSHFGMGVIIEDSGTASGHFECLMAGEERPARSKQIALNSDPEDRVLPHPICGLLPTFSKPAKPAVVVRHRKSLNKLLSVKGGFCAARSGEAAPF